MNCRETNVRRDRRILRSKVYVLLRDPSVNEKYLEILKSSLRKDEIEQVIEDPYYYIPFPEKMKKILENTRSIEELIDNARVKHVKAGEKKPILRMKRPTVLLPIERNPTFKSQLSSTKISSVCKSEKVYNRERVLKQAVNKITHTGSLLAHLASKDKCELLKRGKSNMDLYKDFYKEFNKVNAEYHLRLRHKYKMEVIKKNKTASFFQLKPILDQKNLKIFNST